MIRYGPSGIPLSCKGRTLRDGIEDVHILGLTAMEIQVLRTNTYERMAGEEEANITPLEFSGELIVEVLRGGGKKKESIPLYEEIKKGDLIYSMSNPIARDYTHLGELAEIAKNLDVELSIHTPYYMDLVSDNDLLYKSLDSIKWAGLLAKHLDATMMVTHLGMYGNASKKKAATAITDNMIFLKEWFLDNDIHVPIGVETSGRQEIFGTFSEMIKLCKDVPGLVPIINFSHIHARGNGALKKKEDFQELFDKASQFADGFYHTHFSGVEHEGGNEIRYTPIKKGDLKFEPLAECILDNNIDLTLICGSPLLEHDAIYMKVILERVLSKREARAERQKQKENDKQNETPKEDEEPDKPKAKPKDKKQDKKQDKKPKEDKKQDKKKDGKKAKKTKKKK